MDTNSAQPCRLPGHPGAHAEARGPASTHGPLPLACPGAADDADPGAPSSGSLAPGDATRPMDLAALPEAVLAACVAHLDAASLVAARRSGRLLAAAALDAPALRKVLGRAGIGAAHLPPSGAPADVQRGPLWDRLCRNVALDAALQQRPVTLSAATTTRWRGAALAADGQSLLVAGRHAAYWLELGDVLRDADVAGVTDARGAWTAVGPLRRRPLPRHAYGPQQLTVVKVAPGARFAPLSWQHGLHHLRDLQDRGRLCAAYEDVDALRFLGADGAVVGRDANTQRLFVSAAPSGDGLAPRREPVALPAGTFTPFRATRAPSGQRIGLLHGDGYGLLLRRAADGQWQVERRWHRCMALQFAATAERLVVCTRTTNEFPGEFTISLYDLGGAEPTLLVHVDGQLRAFCPRRETILLQAPPTAQQPRTLRLTAAAPHVQEPLLPALEAAVAGCVLQFTDDGARLAAWPRSDPGLAGTSALLQLWPRAKGPRLRLYDASRLTAPAGVHADAAAALPPPWTFVGDAHAPIGDDDEIQLAPDGRRAVVYSDWRGPARLFALAP